jgi:acyl-CoA thioester hydrolase
MTLDFVKPALMDDVLRVETSTLAIGGASIDMAQAILRESEPLVRAKVRIAVVAGGRAIRIPAEVLAKLKGLAQGGK